MSIAISALDPNNSWLKGVNFHKLSYGLPESNLS